MLSIFIMYAKYFYVKSRNELYFQSILGSAQIRKYISRLQGWDTNSKAGKCNMSFNI